MSNRSWLRSRGAAIGLALVAAWLVAAPPPVLAQAGVGAALEAAGLEPGAAGGAVSDADLEALIATLEDAKGRERLIRKLRALMMVREQATPEVHPEPAGGLLGEGLQVLSQRINALGSAMVSLTEAIARLPHLAASLQTRLSDAGTRAGASQMLLRLLLVLATGLIAQAVAVRLLAQPRATVEGRHAESLAVRAPLLLLRTILELVPVGALAAAAYASLGVIGVEGATYLMAVAAIDLYLLFLVVMVAARMVAAPRVPTLRLFPLGDETANYIVIWVRRVATVAILGFFVAEATWLIGLGTPFHLAILRLTGLAVAAMLIVLVLQNRAEVGRLIRGGRGPEAVIPMLGTLRQRLADIWHILAVVYLIVIYLVWVLEVEGGFEYVARATVLTVVILGLARLAAVGVRRAIARLFAISEELKRQLPALEARANRYLSGAQMALQAVIGIVAGLSILRAWDVDSFAWLGTAFGQRLLGGGFSVVLVLALALFAWEATSTAIERYLSRTDENGETVVRSARARTLLPLLRNVFLVVLVALVVLIVLSELGINITPLLAGVGVIGLAVGFGSRKLVEDVITGAFLLFEDAVSVGDVVQTGDHVGLVEALSIRAIRLRDLAGNLHVVPFSSVDTVVNMTKDLSRYVFEIGIAYREDVDQVVEVLKGIAAEMREDTHFGPLILDPGFEVLGLDAFADSAVIIKARITTPPIKQWEVGREFNRRMKKRFDELGIEIPFPHQTIYFGVDKDDQAPPARVRMQAAGGEAGTPRPVVKPAGAPEERSSDVPSPDASGDGESQDS